MTERNRLNLAIAGFAFVISCLMGVGGAGSSAIAQSKPPAPLPTPPPPMPLPPLPVVPPQIPPSDALGRAIIEQLRLPGPGFATDYRTVTVDGVQYFVRTYQTYQDETGIHSFPATANPTLQPTFFERTTMLNTLFGNTTARQSEAGNDLVTQGLFPVGKTWFNVSDLPYLGQRQQVSQSNLNSVSQWGTEISAVVPVRTHGRPGDPVQILTQDPWTETVGQVYNWGTGFAVQVAGELKFMTAEHVRLTYPNGELEGGGAYSLLVSQGPHQGGLVDYGTFSPNFNDRPDAVVQNFDQTTASALGITNGFRLPNGRFAIGSAVIAMGYPAYNFDPSSSERPIVGIPGTLVGYDPEGYALFQFDGGALPNVQGMSGAPIVLASDPNVVVAMVVKGDYQRVGDSGGGVTIGVTLTQQSQNGQIGVTFNSCGGQACAQGLGTRLGGVGILRGAATDLNQIDFPVIGDAGSSGANQMLLYDLATETGFPPTRANDEGAGARAVQFQADLAVNQNSFEEALAGSTAFSAEASRLIAIGEDAAGALAMIDAYNGQMQTAAMQADGMAGAAQAPDQPFELRDKASRANDIAERELAHTADRQDEAERVRALDELADLIPPQFDGGGGGLGSSTEQVEVAPDLLQRQAQFFGAALRYDPSGSVGRINLPRELGGFGVPLR